jgi:hypothetical protein
MLYSRKELNPLTGIIRKSVLCTISRTTGSAAWLHVLFPVKVIAEK